MEDRTERLAIALEALERLPTAMRNEIIPKLHRDTLLRMGKGERKEDVPALEFSCSLLEAALICDIVRNHDRLAGESPADVYIHRGTTWTRVIFSQVLTVLINGKAALNPAFFTNTNVAAIDDGCKPRPLFKSVKQ